MSDENEFHSHWLKTNSIKKKNYSGEADSANCEETSCLYWNQKIHYSVHKRQLLDRILTHESSPRPIHLRLLLILPSYFFPLRFLTTVLYEFLASPCVLHVPRIPSSLTSSPQHVTKSTIYQAPRYAVYLFILLLLHVSFYQIFFSALLTHPQSICF
jgi:hypothetical protein